MSRAQSVTSGDLNDGAVELEYAKLQRTFRAMDLERKSYAEQTRQLIKKQRAAVDKLTQENKHLIHELHLAKPALNNPSASKPHVLHKQVDIYEKQTKQAISRIKDLDKQIENVHKEISKHRAKIGGVNASLTSANAIDKQIQILENRLNQSLVKYNRSLAHNKQFRMSIDNLRRDRVVFDALYSKFEVELKDLKISMAEIIDQSNSAYEARDEAQAKIVVLSEKAGKEYQAYMQEIKELDRTLEQDRKLRAFLSTKATDRMVQYSKLVTGAHHAIATAGNTHPKQEQDLLSKPNVLCTSSQDSISSLASYDKIVSHIQQVTGVGSIDELVSKFSHTEQEIFSLFNYVNQVNNEAEKLQTQTAQINARIEALNSASVQALADQKTNLSVLEKQLTETQTQSKQLSENTTQDQKVMEHLYTNIQTLIDAFKSANITVTTTVPITQDEGLDSSSQQNSTDPLAPAPITTNPFEIHETKQSAGASIVDMVVNYLATIEHHVNDLLILHHIATTNPRLKLASAATTNAPASSTQANGAGSPPGSPIQSMSTTGQQRFVGVVGSVINHDASKTCVVHVLAPNTGDNDDSDEGDDRPLSRTELANKSIRGLTKRMQNGAVPVPKRRRGGNGNGNTATRRNNKS